MRINKFVAQATGLSRRVADQAIQDGRVQINIAKASLGDEVIPSDIITLDSQRITPPVKTQTIMLNKPAGYICSRDGQGSPTIYELLPEEFHRLKPVGRLDKNSSGLLLLTDDGDLANQLTHPKYAKTKIYEIGLDRPLADLHRDIIVSSGVELRDGPSKLQLAQLDDDGHHWRVTMQQGRNRQIRRTFQALDYTVTALHRTHFGEYILDDLPEGKHRSAA